MPRSIALRGTVAAALLTLTLTLTACGGVSETDLQHAKEAGAQEQAQREAATRQSEAQASLTDEVARLQEEADAAKAADAQAAADAKAKVKADADAKAKADAKKKAAAEARTQCSDRVSAGAHTSCAFALIVEATFYDWGGGNQALNVYSPVTGKWYIMNCAAGVPTVCRGGDNNNAVVYIR